MGQIVRSGQRGVAVAEDDVADKYLTFRLGEDTYAIEVMRVKKIIEFTQPTHVPMVPKFIRGILNLLGEAVPVIDLAICFGETPSEITQRACIIIVEIRSGTKRLDMGVVVDVVNNVIELLPKNISPPPSFGSDIRTQFIHGVGKVEEQFVLLLNMDYILSMEQLSLLSRVREQSTAMLPPAESKVAITADSAQ
jgi:purine-binding chemotaxis protein CheW